MTHGDQPITPELYSAFADNLRRAVDAVPSLSPDLASRLHANVSRFAAYKARQATADIRQALATDDIDAARATLRKYNTYQAAEYNTAVARARTAQQWERFEQPDRVRLFPNIRWIPSRSATPREAHKQFWNRIWAKDDPFWEENQPGTLWNCKCDWQETNKPVTDGNPSNNIRQKGLVGNPAKTGEIFTSVKPLEAKTDPRHPYFANAPEDTPTHVIRSVRDIFRKSHSEDFVVFKTDIGKILFDDITVREITKGAKTDASYFYKLEIAQHFDQYISQLQPLPDETIDLSHNNHNNIFYRRKAMFSCMKVYKLTIHGFDFQIKIGEFKTGGYHIYAITEP